MAHINASSKPSARSTSVRRLLHADAPLAVAKLATRGIDSLARLGWLFDELNPGAVTGFTFDFVSQYISLSNEVGHRVSENADGPYRPIANLTAL
jgi:hypothetical protein